MTRIACKFGLAAAVVLGVAFFTAAPAQAHEREWEHRGRVVPRVIVRGSHYYRPPVVCTPPAPVVVTPTYPVDPCPPTYVPAPAPAPAPVMVTPTYPVYPYTPAYVPAYAPAPVLGAGLRVGPVGVGISLR